ncbi:ATP-binding cassette domain-containing protein [Pseudofrankia sp. BMG5.37]|uniref:ATP-binding cassette domain-containing protein n=1 Tax=Pseudofrankia sp. BMG5.37 TaxID=3050035 RepID=UPI0012FF6D05
MLSKASLVAYRGEVHALVGGNGSGKSMLIQLFAGVVPVDRDGYIATADGRGVSSIGLARGTTGPSAVRASGSPMIPTRSSFTPTLTGWRSRGRRRHR